MASGLQTGNDTSITELVTGIINDAQELTKQQLALFKQELISDFRQTRQVAIAWMVGAAALLISLLMLLFTLAYLLSWALGIHEWGGFGIVTATAIVLGGGLIWAGKKKLDTFNPLPDETVQALKENVECLTKRT